MKDITVTSFRGVEDANILTIRTTETLKADERVRVTDGAGNSIEATIIEPVAGFVDLYRTKIDPATWSYA